MKKYSLLLIVLFFVACSYRITKNADGEPIVDEKRYSFTKKPSTEDLKIVDTTAVYVQIFNLEDSNEQERSNPMTIGFHNDGYFKSGSVKFYGKFDSKRHKNSVYYGGRYYLEGNKIFLEAFYPNSGGATNYYVKEISKGRVVNDTLRLTIFGRKTRYVKRDLSEIRLGNSN